MKQMLYCIKEGIRNLFAYPKEHIVIGSHGDYDVYWKEKRGATIGQLSSWQRERADIICSNIDATSPHISLADIGCGDGSILAYLQSKLPAITRCIGYDSSEFALERARKFGVETHLMDISHTASYSEIAEVDYYLMLELLEHIPNSEELLLSSLRKAKKGVFFSFPNTGYFMYRLRLLFGRFPVQWRIHPNEHVRFWTLQDLIWWLRALNITTFEIKVYRGIPVLNKIFPGLFGAAFVVFIRT